MSKADQKTLIAVARERIEATLEDREPRFPPAGPALHEPSGAFVTLHLCDGSNRALRGCIGHIDASDSIYETVKSVAYSAAFSDYRFRPLTVGELPKIELEISVLSPMRRVHDTSEIVPGEHGLYMRRGGRSGLLLPQVASERNWDRETFLAQTCRKSGLPSDSWKDPQTEIYTFTAQVFDEASCDE